jgi:hypothetical protein
MIGLIGKGVTGSVLQKQIPFDQVFDSKNIDTIHQYEFNTLYCAAPGANRIEANQNPDQDYHNIQQLIEHIKSAHFAKIVLIGTVDSVVKHTPYAKNRKRLEDFVLEYNHATVVRLCSLIGCEIKKNILYDLKNNLYIDKINLFDISQWYPLSNLTADTQSSVGVIDLVSEPIQNIEIISKFFPQYLDRVQKQQTSVYDIQPYRYNKQQIFDAIENYCND